MNSDRVRVYHVERPAQWNVICSPVRMEILQFMRFVAPCSLAELARVMDRPADSLYHHFKRLLAVELVKPLGFKKSGRQTEAIYDLSASSISFDVDPESGRNTNAFKRLASTILRMTDRRLRNSLDEFPHISLSGSTANLVLRCDTAWLNEDALTRVNQHLREIQKLFERGRRRRKGRLFSFTAIFAPVIRSRHSSTNGKTRHRKGH